MQSLYSLLSGYPSLQDYRELYNGWYYKNISYPTLEEEEESIIIENSIMWSLPLPSGDLIDER